MKNNIKTVNAHEWTDDGDKVLILRRINKDVTIHVKMAMDWGKRVERDEGRDPAEAAKLNR